MGPYAGVDYNSPYLIVHFVVSYPPPLKRKRDGVVSGWVHLYLSANFQNQFFLCKHKNREGGGMVWELIFGLWPDISWSMGRPADFNPHVANFNSHKITMNLGSDTVDCGTGGGMRGVGAENR